MPRPNLDIVGYKARDNVLKVVECKSYIDSVGVQVSGFNGTKVKNQDRYKLSMTKSCERPCSSGCAYSLLRVAHAQPDADVKLVQVCGKIMGKDRERLNQHFKQHADWELWDENVASLETERDV